MIWFDDQPWGGCKVPAAWRIYYKAADGSWAEVQNPTRYTCNKGVDNEVLFDAVKTTAVKLEIDQPEGKSCGLFEWEIK